MKINWKIPNIIGYYKQPESKITLMVKEFIGIATDFLNTIENNLSNGIDIDTTETKALEKDKLLRIYGVADKYNETIKEDEMALIMGGIFQNLLETGRYPKIDEMNKSTATNKLIDKQSIEVENKDKAINQAKRL